jgi:DNA-binding CsgD family transcriptional regulator
MTGTEIVLSPRQLDVLRRIAAGLTLSEAATDLGVQETTAKTHLEQVFRKLRVHTQAAAVDRAHRLGILT